MSASSGNRCHDQCSGCSQGCCWGRSSCCARASGTGDQGSGVKTYREGGCIQAAMHSAIMGATRLKHVKGDIMSHEGEVALVGGGAGSEKWGAGASITKTGFNQSLKLRTSGTVSKANKWSNKNNGHASSLPFNTHLSLPSLLNK